MGQLTGKTALVAGAGRNNGKAISIAFAREGADLILVAREKQDSLTEVVKECEKLGAKVLPLMADVSDHGQVERLVQQGLDRFGQIDVLMHCTGRRAHQDFWQISYAEIVIFKKFWPDFRQADLFEAAQEYARRHRRFGGL